MEAPGTAAGRGPRARGEGGASMVELALIAPLLISLILGVVTGGAAYVTKIGFVDAVREGARYGTSLLVPAGAGGPALWEASVRERVLLAAGGSLLASDVCVKLVLATGGTDCGITDPPGAASESGIHVVKVSASRPARIELLIRSFTLTLKARVTARYERDTG